jgi:hypothetical protein
MSVGGSRGRRCRGTQRGLSVLALASVSVLTALPGVAAAAAPEAAAVPVTVSVNPASTTQVGSGFAGFSYEKDRIGARMFDPKNTKLVKLFRRLGPSVLRVGGNLVDMVTWNAGGIGGSATEIAPSDVTTFAAFVKATGWKVIYGINLKTNTPANAADEAQYAAKALGSSLVAFEIGNEPSVYLSETAYEESFSTYVAAIRAKVPTAVFDGPGQADSTSWVSAFAAHEKSNGLEILTTHQYIGSNAIGTIEGMLASNSSGRLPDAQTAMDNAQSANALPQWRMTEANSYYHGGTAGVSNVEAAALWSLDFMAGIATHHGSGVNFHGGTSTQFPLNYSPIAFDGLTPTGVQGVYYGELLWVLAGTGAFHSASLTAGSGVTAWGIGNNAFVNNKGTSTITATISLPATARKASEYVLTASSLTSTAITIAGSRVSSSGTFTPAPRVVTMSGHKVVITIPAHSAALVVTGS